MKQGLIRHKQKPVPKITGCQQKCRPSIHLHTVNTVAEYKDMCRRLQTFKIPKASCRPMQTCMFLFVHLDCLCPRAKQIGFEHGKNNLGRCKRWVAYSPPPPPPPSTFFAITSQCNIFFAKTWWLFSFKSCAHFRNNRVYGSGVSMFFHDLRHR